MSGLCPAGFARKAGLLRAVGAVALVCLFLLPNLHAQSDPDRLPPDPEPTLAAPADERAVDDSDRTELNLLGEVDASGGESRRNENVQLTLIDNNVLKELNIRMGTTATIVREFEADKGYFGGEFGGSPSRQIHLSSPTGSGFHGELYETHQNSVFQARSFFQVGGVKPARSNDYGFRVGTPLWQGANLTVNASQQRNTGNVNGNVLVPRPDERTPLATDPETRSIVERILSSFPDELPNRTDINPRALNTNAIQQIDNDSIGSRLDQAVGDSAGLFFDYRFKIQKVEAFQLVRGQNPNTTTRSHAGKITWNQAWSPRTIFDASVGFQRVTSLITQDETALGPFIFSGRQLESLGGSSSLPIDRAQNYFRYAAMVRQRFSSHELTYGFAIERDQLNGRESSGQLGLLLFSSNFGRTAVENVRHGTPSRISQAFGRTDRGFRRWVMQYFVGDSWKATQKLTFDIGLRYEPSTSPIEVNGLSQIEYGCDCNNFAPSFGFAYRPGRFGVIRAAYGLHYGQIFAATYSQARNNPPSNIRISVTSPNIVDPFQGLDTDNLPPDTRASTTIISPDLAVPYSHHYNFSWEFNTGGPWSLSLGYVGSRTHRLLVGWPFNRAVPVEGIAQTTATVNQRRPDPRFFDVRHILNGSRAYYDAAKVDFSVQRWAGVSLDFSYWFGKAIDLGAHYASNAGTRDAFAGRSQSEFEVHGDAKALSDFDQPHAAQWSVTYETPQVGGAKSAWNQVFGQWELFSVILLKTGTPFIIRSGSDAPGFGNVDGVAGDRMHILDPSIIGSSIDHPDTSRQRLPFSAFGFIQPGELRGNLARNAFRKDGIRNINTALSRTWKVGGDRSLTLTAESINFFNTPQFADPGGELSGANFGVITNTLNDGRTFRFTLRFAY